MVSFDAEFNTKFHSTAFRANSDSIVNRDDKNSNLVLTLLTSIEIGQWLLIYNTGKDLLQFTLVIAILSLMAKNSIPFKYL